MAKPTKIKNKDGSTSYKIILDVTINGTRYRENKRFNTAQLAKDWHDKRKNELEHESIYGTKNNRIIRDVINEYLDKFGASYGQSKKYDLARLTKYPIANIAVDKLTQKHLIQHCIERNKEVKPQTVKNDLIWLRVVIRTMAAVDGYVFDNSVFENAITMLSKEKLIARPALRDRLPTFSEMLRLSRYFKKRNSKIPMFDIMWFAYFSARRLAEITRLRWDDNNEAKQTGLVTDLKHPTQKKGNNKRFKYEKTAWRIVQRQLRISEYIFPYNHETIGTYFDNACNMLDIKNLHFHDLRHAATSRLFKQGYTIEQVQLFTLHQDWKTLSRYTHIRPEDID